MSKNVNMTATKYPSRVIGLVALPRSGTTVLTSVFSVHSRFECVYEPWNASKNKIDIHKPTSFIRFMQDFSIDCGRRDVLLVKETATELDYLRRITELLSTAPETVKGDLIILLRDPFHVFLSEVQARREWWGEANLTLTSDVFDRWAKRTLQATKMLQEMAVKFNALLLSYEAFIASNDVLSRLMKELDLELEPNQLQYEVHLNTRKVRGDVALANSPRPLSTESVSRRTAEMETLMAAIGSSDKVQSIEMLRNMTTELASLGCVRPNSGDFKFWPAAT